MSEPTTTTTSNKNCRNSAIDPMHLYIVTNQLILKAETNADNISMWELYKLLPDLKLSLSCTVCRQLLRDPVSPLNAKCVHHVCSECTGEGQFCDVIADCEFCKDCTEYRESNILRVLTLCYRKTCSMLLRSTFYERIRQQAKTTDERHAHELMLLIQSDGGTVLPPSPLPPPSEDIQRAADDNKCGNTNGINQATQTVSPPLVTPPPSLPPPPPTQSPLPLPQCRESTIQKIPLVLSPPPLNSIQSGPELATYVNVDTKPILLQKKRKLPVVPPTVAFNVSPHDQNQQQQEDNVVPVKLMKPPQQQAIDLQLNNGYKRPPFKSTAKIKKGCRCGNATTMPGKLTCCGQRCPCYVESKACLECKCRGCRNPHRADGVKILPCNPSRRSPLTYLPFTNMRSHVVGMDPLQYPFTQTSQQAEMLPAVKLNELAAITSGQPFSLDNTPITYHVVQTAPDVLLAQPRNYIVDEINDAESPISLLHSEMSPRL